MLIEAVMPKAPERLAAVSSGAPIRDAASLMSRPHTDLVVISDAAGVMIGVLTKTDIVGYIPDHEDRGE